MVEVNGDCYDYSLIDGKNAMRRLTDAMPLSRNKIDLVNNLGQESKLSYYMPIIKYHNDLKKNPLNLINPRRRGYNILRGVYIHAQNKKPKEVLHEPDGKTLGLIPEGEKVLMEFLDLCDQSGIENILFCRFPHIMYEERTYTHYKRYNTIAKIVRDRGYEYIDFDEMIEETGLERDHDYYDGEHLNGYGQQKFTAGLGSFLVEKYNLSPTTLTDKQREEWEVSADYIQRFYKLYDDHIQKNGFYNLTKKQKKQYKAEGRKYYNELHEYRRVMNALEKMGPVNQE